MTILDTRISTADEEFLLNRQAYDQVVADLHARRRRAREGGPPKARARHVARDKLLPRDRIDALLDPGSPFLEVAQLAGEDKYEGVPPGASIITGIGLVSGRPCMIIANDATVKGGTYYGMTCKKHVRAQRIAWEHRLPSITLVDSGGAFLPDQANIFPDTGQFGTIFNNLVRMSAEGIPQIAVVMGPCTAGGAYIPSLCDEVVIVRGQGYMYLGGPELTFAATGEEVDNESLGGAQMHCSVSGVTDHIAEDDRHALAIAREIVLDLGEQSSPRWTQGESLPPRHDPQEIYGIISRDPRIPTNTREILTRFVDDSRFQEFKPLYGDTLLTGFARIHGYEVGILANQGVLFSESAMKATHFIELCCQRDIPLVFMSDVTGFMVGRTAEQGGIAKAGAKMITAMASANVPKYTIMIGASYGAGYLAMCGRPFNPTAMFAWPTGRAAIMGPEQAATVLALVRGQILSSEGKAWSAEEEEAFKAPIRREYEAFQVAYNFSSNLWVDGILDPVETRDVMGLMLDLAARVPAKPTNFGVFRV
ncbi:MULTISPECIES: carboxyl transferase domain-containing protein [Noviherbaspirillum]|uniref:carboxyl transferase domain-containing protein n=1 Tax=Noviherbaspirillum TaxID=1344552 RepID=UPI00124C2966|nr:MULTISPECIES: carboxyl transferase domain-containing protein [Noviherbaspirillum]